MARILFLATLLVAHGASCGDGDNKSGIPQPDPIPNLMRIQWTGAPDDGVGSVDVVGLTEATAGAGQVTVRASSGTKTVEATDEGSFFASIEARKGEFIEISYKKSKPVELEVLQLKIVDKDPSFMSDPPPINAPIDGKAKVFARTDPVLAVLGINLSNTAIATTTVSEERVLTFDIEASSGDTINVYLGTRPLSSPWVLKVP